MIGHKSSNIFHVTLAQLEKCVFAKTHHNTSLFTITDADTTFSPTALSRLKQAQFI